MKAKQRNSNIELLRIICMIMILAIHANFFSTGSLTECEANSEPLSSILRSFAHAICVGAVNTFVMISGYFGIRFKIKGLTNLLFQSLFFCVGVYAILVLLNLTELSKINIASSLMLFKQAEFYWFVWAYIILYILSPCFNMFAENSTKKEFQTFLILFFIFQYIIDSTPHNNYFRQGYSPLAFIGIYMLARYFRIYKENINKSVALCVFSLMVIINTLLEFSIKKFGIDNGIVNTVSSGYTNPITIIQSLALLLYFSKLNIQNRFINWISASYFAVYLFHMHFCIVDYYKEYAFKIYQEYSSISYISVITVFIAIFFIMPIIIDKVRIHCFIKLWNYIERRCQQKN